MFIACEIKFSLCFLKYLSFVARDLINCFRTFLQHAVIAQKAAFCITTLSSSSKLTHTKLLRQRVQQNMDFYLTSTRLLTREKISVCILICLPVAAAARCWDCGFESRRIMDICLLWLSCVVRWRSLRWADNSSRGILPTVIRRCVWSKYLVNEDAVAQWGPSLQKQFLFI